jgi:hypothetical protein
MRVSGREVACDCITRHNYYREKYSAKAESGRWYSNTLGQAALSSDAAAW